MLGSVGEGGGATSVELRMSMLIEEEGEVGITHCKREVFLKM